MSLVKKVFPLRGRGFVSLPSAPNPLYSFSPRTIKGHINRPARMFADINMVELGREYLRHTDYPFLEAGNVFG